MIYHLEVGKRDEKAKAKIKVYADTKATAPPSEITAGKEIFYTIWFQNVLYDTKERCIDHSLSLW